MGRGLAAILSVAPKDESQELRELPVDLIGPNPRQPRSSIEDDSLAGLAESIRARGVLQPVLVRPLVGGRYELIAGERRWRAARLAERETVPAVIRRGDDAASLELALIENMAREELNPVDEAKACAALVDELGLSREEVGIRVGRGRVAVSNLIRLLELPDEALELIERGRLTEGHGRALLLTDDHAERRSLARAAANAGWSVRELESRARAAGASRSRTTRPPRSALVLHPDQQAMVEQIADTLQPVFGREVAVTLSKGHGFRIQVQVESVEDALALARRLRVRSAA
jgi:ParB family chromosome partitioning protein